MDIDRDFDIIRIIGQLEANINAIISTSSECRQRQQSEQDKIYKLFRELKDDLISQRDFINVRVATESEILRTLILLKYDIESANKLIKEIDNIKDILGLDNTDKVKKNWYVMNSIMNYILYTIAGIGLLISMILAVNRIFF
jgi:hypothetical protein